MRRSTVFALVLAVVLALGGVQFAQADVSVPFQQDEPPPDFTAAADYRSSNPTFQTAAEVQAFWTQERLDEAQPIPDWVYQGAVPEGAGQETGSTANGPAMVSAPVIPGGVGLAAVAYQAPGYSTAAPNFAYPHPFTTGLVDTAFYGFYPWRVNGKLFFTNAAYGAGTFVCSGTVITSGANASGNENLILTSGVCVNSGGSGGVLGTWSQNMSFSPGYTGAHPQGLWSWSNAWSHPNWTLYSNWRQSYGFVVVNSNIFGCGTRIQTCYGAQGVAWNQYAHRDYWVTGYPQAAPYTGNRQIFCSSELAKRGNVAGPGTGNVGEYAMGIGCPQTGGAEGASWIIRGNVSNGGYANSATSWKWNPNDIYGPYYDGEFGWIWGLARTDMIP